MDSSLIVLQQMVIIFILIGIGMALYRKNMLSENTSKELSGLIINVTNPALLICSAFEEGPKASLSELLLATASFAAVYAILIFLSFLIPYLLRVPKKIHYAYRMLTIFGNTGFIGIPLCAAVLGSQSLIYVAIFNLLFNFLIYTFGIHALETAAAQETPADASPTSQKKNEKAWKKLLFNAGTISGAVTIVCYLGDFSLPYIVSSSLQYIARATTLLSMLVLGVSTAQMPLKAIFSDATSYAFILLRQILVPIGVILLMRPFVHSALISDTLLVMCALPAGNMPLMLSKQLNMDTEAISRGIILTTIFSLVTVPLACLFLS